MLKKIMFFLFLLNGGFLLAQSFTEVLDSPFEGVRFSATALADIDNDGDIDVLLMGDNGTQSITKLYRNEGGLFTEVSGTPFIGVSWGAADFSDVDGNGYQDLLITGDAGFGDNLPVSKLYLNENGNFTEAFDTPFAGTLFSDLAFSDIDDDGDEDVVIAGFTVQSIETSLYLNDGGNFTKAVDVPFVGVGFCSIAFSDINGDGDEDLLISGATNSTESEVTKLYINEKGIFTELLNTPFVGVAEGSVALSDIDGDGDKDVLITGTTTTGPFEFERNTRLYLNEGNSFSEVQDAPFEKVNLSAVAFSDVDGDGDEDLFITGDVEFNPDSPNPGIAKLYINNNATFTELIGTPFESVGLGSVEFADIDDDGDQDLLMTGQGETDETFESAKLYLNEGNTSSTESKGERMFQWTLFPNPTPATRLNVSLGTSSTQLSDVVMSIYGIDGQLLMSQKEVALIQGQTIQLDISHLPSGQYKLEVRDGNMNEAMLFVVIE